MKSAYFVIAIWAVFVIGWIMNIYKLISIINDPISGLFIARIAGIFLAPFGSIIGFF